MKTLQLLFGLRERVSRREYLLWGVVLMALKYLGELAMYHQAFGQMLPPWNFLSPVLDYRYPAAHATSPDWFFPGIVLWSIPFIWIGTGMSIRRAADAGISPWIGLLFFVPGVNYFLMLFLAVAGTSGADTWNPDNARTNSIKLMHPLALTIIFAIAGTLLTWFSTNFLRVYATSLFVGSPLILGFVQGYLIGCKRPRNFKAAAAYAGLTVFLIHLFLLLFALEGVICLVMSLPLSLPLAVIGGILGSAIASYAKPSLAAPAMMLLALPLMPVGDRFIVQTSPDMVLSTIVIDAPPEKVWPNVVKFSDLPPTDDWLFKLGVAYPVRARIEGEGVGAVRRCEFSTGAFVEPITAWEQPNRLAFNVRFQPQPMKELSFYDRVDAPHLNGYFRSVRGEFHLVPTADGKTRLEGRTWYEVDMQPGWYWHVYGRAFIHKIHMRVLAHIKDLSETRSL